MLVARFYGAQQEQEAQEAVHTAVVVSILGGILLAFIGKNRHRLNKITQVSEVNLRRPDRYLHPYTFLQLTLLTPFAVCQVLMRK